MKNDNAFSKYHPLVNFSYFFAVITFSMFLNHPVFLGISAVFAFLYSVKLNGIKALKFNLIYLIPLLIFSAIINPLFNHEGATILAYFKNGNPLTYESILYGLSQALIIVSVIMWFSCFNRVITSDKFIYLFGRIIPSLSLILSMILRFVPEFKRQYQEVKNAQLLINTKEKSGNIIVKIKDFAKLVSIMVTRSLENAVDTADSMKSRGYGLKGRTSFSIYTFSGRDISALLIIIILIIYLVYCVITGVLSFSYFPVTDKIFVNAMSLSAYLSYALLCVLPLVMEIKEDYKWKSLKLKI